MREREVNLENEGSVEGDCYFAFLDWRLSQCEPPNPQI